MQMMMTIQYLVLATRSITVNAKPTYNAGNPHAVDHAAVVPLLSATVLQ
jgi:hypothetical protein